MKKVQKQTRSGSITPKLNICIPAYSGEKTATKTNKFLISRSVSGLKKYRNMHDTLTPRKKINTSFNTEQIKNYKKLGAQKLIKTPMITTPVNLSQQASSMHKNLSKNYFKSDNVRKILHQMNKVNERKQQYRCQSREKMKHERCGLEIRPIKKLASGQYGSIYLGVDVRSNWLVVIKAFNKAKVNVCFMIDQFKIQLYCRHPNILPAYGFYIGRKECFLIMEAGVCNLYSKLKRQGIFSEQKAALSLYEIMKGLLYLHLNGIIHRDIKPQNIIVCSDDTLKITDFGWSIISSTERQTFCGTIDYVSPEVSQGRPYDTKIDCWSIGILAYEMIVGFPPFPIVDQDADRPLLNYEQRIKFPHGTSSNCKNFIKKMLQVNPKFRPNIKQAMFDDWITEAIEKKQSKQISDMQLL